jgi:hypothetical protein
MFEPRTAQKIVFFFEDWKKTLDEGDYNSEDKVLNEKLKIIFSGMPENSKLDFYKDFTQNVVEFLSEGSFFNDDRILSIYNFATKLAPYVNKNQNDIFLEVLTSIESDNILYQFINFIAKNPRYFGNKWNEIFNFLEKKSVDCLFLLFNNDQIFLYADAKGSWQNIFINQLGQEDSPSLFNNNLWLFKKLSKSNLELAFKILEKNPDKLSKVLHINSNTLFYLFEGSFPKELENFLEKNNTIPSNQELLGIIHKKRLEFQEKSNSELPEFNKNLSDFFDKKVEEYHLIDNIFEKIKSPFSGFATNFFDKLNSLDFSKMDPAFRKFFIEKFISADPTKLIDYLATACSNKESRKFFIKELVTNHHATLFDILQDELTLEDFCARLPDLFSEQDDEGNSLLFHLTENKDYQNSPQILKTILEKVPQAKFLIAKKEIKNPLILMITSLASDEEIAESFLQTHIGSLNQQDEVGKTALIYAITLGKNSALNQLLQYQNIDFLTPDQTTKNALQYLIVENHCDQFDTLSERPNFLEALNQCDNWGFSSLTMACFAVARNNSDGSIVSKVLDYPGYKNDQSKFDNLFFDLCQKLGFIGEDGKILPNYYQLANNEKSDDLKEELEKIYHRDDIDPNIRKALFFAFANKQNKSWDIFKATRLPIPQDEEKFAATGIELEVVNAYHYPFPMDFLDKFYDIDAKKDEAVINSFFMYRDPSIQEITSQPIQTRKQLIEFLELSDYLQKSGVMVNKATGFHIHINVNNAVYGKMVDQICDKTGGTFDENQKEQIELLFIKQIAVNFLSLQHLLQGFMKNGRLFNDETRYTKLILQTPDSITELLKAETIGEMCGERHLTLNLENLFEDGERNAASSLEPTKGTIEFRPHEGAVDPNIIVAWVNFVHRSVNISIDKLARKINLDNIDESIAKYKVEAEANIEDLVYLLIADRQYQESWDKKSRIVKNQYGSTAVPIGGSEVDAKPDQLAGKIAQEEIQESPFYHSLQAGEILPEIKDPQDIVQLNRMIALKKKYPDISDSKQKPPSISPSTSENVSKEKILQLSNKIPEGIPNF